MKNKFLLFNARVHTQAETRHRYARLIADSIAVQRGTIVAVGNSLQYDPEFKSFDRINLRGKSVIPGLVDAHTHFVFYAISLANLSLQDETSLDGCLKRIKSHAARLGKTDWIFGEGFVPSRIGASREPIRILLDRISGGRPLFIFSKDQHSAWANSRALELAGIDAHTPDPEGGRIDRTADNSPSGILYEGPAETLVYSRIPQPDQKKLTALYNRAVKVAYAKGVTGVHSFDSPYHFGFLSDLAERGKLGLRINYYPPARMLSALAKTKTGYGAGNKFFRVAGVKIFADGSLGSRTAHCFKPYAAEKGKEKSFGIEVTTVAQMKTYLAQAARLGLPGAIHAIGDKAVANVIEAIEATPKLRSGARHRIEHMQMMRPADIKRLAKLAVIGSMQPSHLPSDIEASRSLWGSRSRNTFLFRSLLDSGIDLAFGSDLPIEPLSPIEGIAAAVRRAKPGSRDVFYPDQRISIYEALFSFTAGPAIASGEADRRGFLLPGYPADITILADDLTRIPPTQLHNTAVLATLVAGQTRYCHSSLKL